MEAKRVEAEGYSPVFWRKAPDSSSKHEAFLLSLLGSPDIIALVAEGDAGVVGFAIGAMAMPPPVYAPGGPVCIVADYAVKESAGWSTVGSELLESVAQAAKARGAVLLVVVCPRRDNAKRDLLEKSGCSVASEWHVRVL